VPVDRGREIEAALIVYAEAPQAIGHRLADLQALAEFGLLARATQAIEDIYFDTTDRALQARLIALRVRRVDGTVLVTMKADSHLTAAGEDRLETEFPWSSAALRRVVSQLRSRGVGISGSPAEPDSADPAAAMASLGLEQVQTRVTTRTPRDVVARGKQSGPLAELAIDAVTYRFGAGRVRLLEVEVEAKGGGDASTVERITTRLRDEFPSRLRPWPYGKLPTGQAIQELLADGQLDGLTGQDGMLRPAAYERIAEVLSRAATSRPPQVPG
jgi:inorganic triphosphatase YgiF